MNTQNRTVQALGEAVESDLDDEYVLVYNSHRDVLPDDVVAALVTGENPWETKGGEFLREWENDVCWASASHAVDDLANEIARRWELEDEADYRHLLRCEWPDSDERTSLISIVQDRDHSAWFSEQVNQHGAVLLRVRITALDEDAGLSYTAVTPEQLLDLVGFEHSHHNLRLAGEVVANASPEFSVAIGQALIGLDLAAVANLPEHGTVELRNPHVWLGSPFTGSGWCSEEAFTGMLTVDRGDLRTDDTGFGYSWNDVAGGVCPSDFSGDIAVTPAR